VLDDPNLIRSRYGFVRYAELASDAERNDYHVAMALIPLDAWYSSSGASKIFRQHAHRLSLLVHGNDHVRAELGRDYNENDIDALLSEALRRVQRLEHRTGIRVARVMAPPHGRCSAAALGGLDRTGFDAICSTLAYGWSGATPDLAGWEPGGFAVGCVGALPRAPLSVARDDLSFRAYLNQPLILYGHHEDLAGGDGLLSEIATDIHRLGAVRFGGMDAIVESRTETRLEGSLFRIRLLARRARLVVPAEAEEIEVELHPSLDPGGCRAVTCAEEGGAAETLPVDGAPVRFASVDGRSVELRLISRAARDVESMSPPRRRIWPTARRIITYSRDQALPLVPKRV
jgi:hypothetical protein